MLNISVKFHYDNMRRVAIVDQDYYYAPLPNTPFSLGIVLPSNYKTWMKARDEIQSSLFLKINFADFFVGQNWKVHPDWVYCKYHYLEGHEFESPEIELLHFLEKMNDKEFKWAEQYEENAQKLDSESYYCNKELFQNLVFEAKVTNSSYGTWTFGEEKHIIDLYNATLRFVATMSGLTRWQFIFGEIEVDTDREFGDYHTKAIEETWYKSAVLQHIQLDNLETDSYVFSVPHYGDAPEGEELKVTASLSLIIRDGLLKSPTAVVGYQFSHQKMFERFMNITSSVSKYVCFLILYKYEII